MPGNLPPAFGLAEPGGDAAGEALLPKVAVLLRLRAASDADALERQGWRVGAHVGRVVSAYIRPDQIVSLAQTEGVVRVDPRLPQRLHLDVNTVENRAVEARAATGLSGAGVLIGVIDTGIDWTHDDFRRADGRTRVRALWDQLDDTFAASGGTIGTAPPARGADGDPFGTVYTTGQIDAALMSEGVVNSVDLVGHGTHVAACAASGGRAPGAFVGVAPEAELLVVRVGGESKDDVFLTGDVLAALQWIGEQATESGLPVSVNMSFGSHVGAHDGTSADETAIDDFVSQPGRVVTVSAGNEGSDGIHSRGSARGSRAVQLGVTPSSSDFVSVSCWLRGGDVVDLGFIDPVGGGLRDANVAPGDCVEKQTGRSRVTLCIDDVDPVNGDREVLFEVEPRTDGDFIAIGTWLLVLRDEGGVGDGDYDCWSETGQRFTADVDSSLTVAVPATARGAIAVGAADFRDTWASRASPETRLTPLRLGELASFSSIGPTRDGRVKPDITTGGNWVLAAWSRADGSGSGLAGVPADDELVSTDGLHVASRGTSFSAPQVAGAAALLLQSDPNLRAADVAAVLRRSARRDSFTGSVPNPRWGYGELDVAAAVATLRSPCVADCDQDGRVAVDELVTAVSIALSELPLAACTAADGSADSVVTVDELVAATNAALQGCVL